MTVIIPATKFKNYLNFPFGYDSIIPKELSVLQGKEKQTVIPTQGMSVRKEGDGKGCRGERKSPSPSGEQDLN